MRGADLGFSFSNNNGVGEIIFDLPDKKVNLLSRNLLLGLGDLLDKIKADINAKGGDYNLSVLLFSSAKEGCFIAGADISEISQLTTKEQAHEVVLQGQGIMQKIADLPCITIAVINGVCLGGGTELALACKYRIATYEDRTKIGLPETRLGIIPGFGGTQRLSRLISFAKALDLLISGGSVNANKAYSLGLIDAYYPSTALERRLRSFIEDCKDPQKSRRLILARARRKNFLDRFKLYRKAVMAITKKKVMAKQGGRYPALIEIMKILDRTYEMDLKDGLRFEAKAFSDLAVTDVCRNLISLFFLQEALKKDKVVDGSVKIQKVKNISVVGAGVMGAGIVWLFSDHGYSVRMHDLSNTAIVGAYKTIADIYKRLKGKGVYNSMEVSQRMNNITHGSNMDAMQSMDLVIEAIKEDLPAKQRTLRDIEERLHDDAFIATNTSSFRIDDIAASLKRPDRFIGMHFFNPVQKMPLVEIVVGKDTSETTIASIVSVARGLGKLPLVVKDCPGFLVNRILMPYLNEAALVVEETTVEYKELDKVMKCFGMPMGPFELLDRVGIDIAGKVGGVLQHAYSDRVVPSTLLKSLYEERKFYGAKTGSGFYIYDGNKLKDVNHEVLQILVNIRKKADRISDDAIKERLIYVMFAEAARCLEEKIVAKPEQVDIALVAGMGFPPFRGGLLRYVMKKDLSQVVARMKVLEKMYGERFRPVQLLLDMVADNKKFY